ncbi:segregation and condensation protein B [[Eubacterium] yurii subsp. margaretiae ATCC 43715]|nr:segregation and condensation protein B [[Eubacterium] yurii subsp. margaretiae ATCC 43715]
MSFFDDEKAMSIVESYIFTFSDLVDVKDIIEMFNLNEIFIDSEYVVHILELLSQKYKENSSGLEILKIEDKYQLVTKRDNFKYIEKVITVTKKKNLTQSAMETLSIIAYNQPVTKSFIEKIKGVKSDTTISKLLEASLIEESARLDTVGRPVLYKTTDLFLKYMGLTSLDELPELNKNRDDGLKEEEVNAQD